jgi:AmmeMemoRadiSam system protein B/AmmeMemoRadiSam system radical SAM enzyme/AmmeMemoRadiSam system protein A
LSYLALILPEQIRSVTGSVMKTRVANEPLADLMDRHTARGAPELCRPEGGRVRCLACGHRCLIGDGLRGICKVRYNEGGELRVPFGYVAALQCDPVEKKPFFHVHPGSDALTFGMLGCDLHCSYCFLGDTPVVTNRGPLTLEEAFRSAGRVTVTHDAEVALPDGLQAVAASGELRKVRGVFRHHYRGRLTVLRPYYLPAVRCTPDHRVYATADPSRPPEPIPAGQLTPGHYLAIPRRYAFGLAGEVDVQQALATHQTTYKVGWELSPEQRQFIVGATARGQTSRQIGAAMGKSASYIRHVRSKMARGRGEDTRTAGVLCEAGTVRFPNERRPGTPRTLRLDADLARLLGYYCAEGCVCAGQGRPNSYALNFSFSPSEGHLVDTVCGLLEKCLGLKAQRVRRDTTLAVAVSKASAALLFKSLAGEGAASKRVPQHIFAAPREIVQAFLDAYLEGDGHRYPNGKHSATTVSRELAYGVAWLALKLGHQPSVYDAQMPEEGLIQGRPVKRSPHQYAVVWYKDSPVERRVIETPDFHLVPLREVSSVEYDGAVYNMEVEEEHNYLANFFLVSNCQNWITSQALRDTAAVAPLRPVSPARLVEQGLREGARLVVSSYNEPLITAEWAVAVFREARAAGLDCAFVSNGNATPEVLDYLRPWIVSYKIDLKSFDERHYRELGGTLENVTRSIRMVHERGIWLEVVTLVIPGFNDSADELRRAAAFLASVSPDVPWHVTAFHPDYNMSDTGPTPAETLVRAAEIGTAAGLRFVYAGNLPGRVGEWENTRCPACRATLIRRYGYLVRSYRITPEGRCPDCQARVPGVWPGAGGVHTGEGREAYLARLPRRVSVELPLLAPRPQAPQGAKAMPTPEPEPAAERPPAAPRPDLSAALKEQLAAAAAAMLRDAVHGRPVAFPADLPELRDCVVAGAFVSLKRGKHLRSCCGGLGQPGPLGRALEQAAARTAREDQRFPPVSPGELDHLDMEVWLLFNAQAVAARGEGRAAAVVVGTHGVQVARGQAHGLYLPSVAVQGGWDALRLLDQVCAKAGLPPTAWREDDTALYTFEGEAIRASLAAPGGPAAPARPASPWPPGYLAGYADFCRGNLGALLSGAMPSYYYGAAPDGTVTGAVLTLSQPGEPQALHFSQLSLRPGLPLQATLFGLTQAAAQALAAQRLAPEVLRTLQVGLTVLHDPILHGTVADPHLAGLDPHHRAALVLERNKSALLFDPGRKPWELLAEAARQAQVTNQASATVYSLDALSTLPGISVSTAPRPVRGPAVRPPAVAGSFYPADAAELRDMIDRLLAGTDGAAEDWPAAMVPHAGLRFSGRVASAVLKRVRIPDTVIVLGPKHTALGMEWAVAPQQTWAMPGGGVESDPVLARRLSQAIPGLELDAAAHQREHAVEVELPLLARLAPEAKVVGIAVGHGDLDDCLRFAEGLAGVLKQRPDRPLLLISSDMNHFATDAETRRLDEMALAALEGGDPEGLYETVRGNHISMCGLLPAVIVLETLRLLGGGGRARRAGYGTSADVTGDPSRVVGYAGMLLG